MPGFDQTGPQGSGPMTGGRRGNCQSEPTGFINFLGRQGGMFRNRNRGYGGPGRMRGGFGNGFCRGYRRQGYQSFMPQATPSKEDELNFLRNEAQDLKETIKGIESRIQDLEKDDTSNQ